MQLTLPDFFTPYTANCLQCSCAYTSWHFDICRSPAFIVTTAPTGRLPCQTSTRSEIHVGWINCYILNPSVLLGQEHDNNYPSFTHRYVRSKHFLIVPTFYPLVLAHKNRSRTSDNENDISRSTILLLLSCRVSPTRPTSLPGNDCFTFIGIVIVAVCRNPPLRTYRKLKSISEAAGKKRRLRVWPPLIWSYHDI